LEVFVVEEQVWMGSAISGRDVILSTTPVFVMAGGFSPADFEEAVWISAE
jgi:hypothetical protein